MQKLLIRCLFNPLSRLTGKLSEKSREHIFILSGLGIFIYNFLYNMNVLQWRYLFSFAICSVLLAVMVLATMPKRMDPVKFNPWFMVCWFGASGFILLSGLIRNTNYLSEALLLAVAYPVIYFCWNNRNAASIFRLLLKLCKISLVIFFVASFLFVQITSRRYGGIFRNVNNCASYLVLTGVCLLVEILYENNTLKRNVVNVVLFGMCYGMIELTNSRSGKLALLCAAAVGIVMYCVTNKFRLKKAVIACLASCVLLSTVMSGCLISVFQVRQYLPLPYFDRINYTLYYTADWLQKPIKDSNAADVTIDPNNTDDPDIADAPGKPVELIDPDSYDRFRDNKNSIEGKTLDQYSSGRISIWKAYLSRLTLFGVAKKEPVIVEGRSTPYNTTHMTPMEVAYESGIFAGVFYLLVNLISGILTIMYAWRQREEKFALLPLMVVLAFGIISYTTSVHSSFNYMLTFYYYLIIFPVIAKGRKEPDKSVR